MPRVPLKRAATADRITRIISGGQTGADRGGLDAALVLGIPHGGWCPKGRKAEDGRVPAKYQLKETDSFDYPKRTRRNIAEADATIVFVQSLADAGPGSRLTIDEALAMHKPMLLIELVDRHDESVRRIKRWQREHHIKTLNVGGSRESKVPGIERAVRGLLVEALGREYTLKQWLARRYETSDCTGGCDDHPVRKCKCDGACGCHWEQAS